MGALPLVVDEEEEEADPVDPFEGALVVAEVEAAEVVPDAWLPLPVLEALCDPHAAAVAARASPEIVKKRMMGLPIDASPRAEGSR